VTPEEKEDNMGWNYIMEGRYEDACTLYERLLTQTIYQGGWFNFGIALLMTGDAQAAEQAFRHMRQLPMARWGANLKVGVALWCQGKYEEACADWQQELVRIKTTELRYRDASGLFIASLLWWATQRMESLERSEAALMDLRLLRGWEEQAEEWGAVLAACILGEISPDEVLFQAARTLDLDVQPLSFTVLVTT